MTDARTALTALITEHSALSGTRAGRLADKIAAEWLPAQDVVDRDALAEVFSRHRYALGHDGIVSDGEFAWLDCTCGFKQVLELPEDDIRIAEAAWERHLADAILTVITDAADVRRQTAEDIAAAIEADRNERWQRYLCRTEKDGREPGHAYGVHDALARAACLAREVGGSP